ncbi:hypothetical protein [Streptomyces gardneri]|uniref:hypothetical protein n=1 Tax=Streptomyces gardneri TaxID=66892 RepID=UPI0034020EAD
MAAHHVRPRLTRKGSEARVRGKTQVRAERTVKDDKGRPVIGADGRPVKAWSASLAKAGKQHIASGASRLRPVVEDAATNGGRPRGRTADGTDSYRLASTRARAEEPAKAG